jgi:hypothetical protein
MPNAKTSTRQLVPNEHTRGRPSWQGRGKELRLTAGCEAPIRRTEGSGCTRTLPAQARRRRRSHADTHARARGGIAPNDFHAAPRRGMIPWSAATGTHSPASAIGPSTDTPQTISTPTFPQRPPPDLDLAQFMRSTRHPRTRPSHTPDRHAKAGLTTHTRGPWPPFPARFAADAVCAAQCWPWRLCGRSDWWGTLVVAPGTAGTPEQPPVHTHTHKQTHPHTLNAPVTPACVP